MQGEAIATGRGRALATRLRRLRMPLPVALSLLVILGFGLAALFAEFVAPYNPFDLRTLDLRSALKPPMWIEGGSAAFVLGTDDQGRDILSAIIYGLRISIMVGVLAVALAAVLGGTLGLVAGYFGGWVDALIMRMADVQSSFPALLVALLLDGVMRVALGGRLAEHEAILVLVLAIGLSFWVDYARTIRAATMVEKGKDYVSAALISGVSSLRILLAHVLPNAIGPLLVLAAINSALAVSAEAVLSFLGVGVSPDKPSLGTLIRIGNDYLLAGRWWFAVFPSLALVLLVLSINVFGDWLRERSDPKSRGQE